MYIIVGLGNPTAQYAGTRHNIGFDAIDALAEKMSCGVDTKKHKALIGSGRIGAEKVVLAKPQTYMNLSGESVRALVDFYKIDPEEELIIIYDDISLEPGKIRIRTKGSAGGHNGIKSIIAHLGTQTFKRIKIGVGEKPPKMDLADYVLGHFQGEDKELAREGADKASLAAAVMILEGPQKAMNQYN
ncbi:MAG: aminoacyl-tRNA hydrolase [Lachnospiraceae bacterium]|nr:aminoacyl-tRNA hydrolase [Lachnospiraceae bacterium]